MAKPRRQQDVSTEQVALRLTPSEKQQVQRLAAAAGTSTSDLLRLMFTHTSVDQITHWQTTAGAATKT